MTFHTLWTLFRGSKLRNLAISSSLNLTSVFDNSGHLSGPSSVVFSTSGSTGGRLWCRNACKKELNHPLNGAYPITGSPSSKYEHRRASALLGNVQNIRICMGEKTYRFCNQRKWKDFNKKQFTLLKMCVTSLLCGPRADLWPFYGFLCKRFVLNLYIEQERKPFTWTHKTDIKRP